MHGLMMCKSIIWSVMDGNVYTFVALWISNIMCDVKHCIEFVWSNLAQCKAPYKYFCCFSIYVIYIYYYLFFSLVFFEMCKYVIFFYLFFVIEFITFRLHSFYFANTRTTYTEKITKPITNQQILSITIHRQQNRRKGS